MTDSEIDNILMEFPELGQENIAWEKEVCAHFGRTCFGFSLIEHSLINTLTFNGVGTDVVKGKIKNKLDWENSFDNHYGQSKKYTFGNLIARALKIEEYRSVSDELNDVKKIRDYFVHHFLREEVAFFGDRDSCLLMISRMNLVHKKVDEIEGLLRICFESMCKRLKLPIPDKRQVESEILKHIQDAKTSMSEGVKFGWEQ